MIGQFGIWAAKVYVENPQPPQAPPLGMSWTNGIDVRVGLGHRLIASSISITLSRA